MSLNKKAQFSIVTIIIVILIGIAIWLNDRFFTQISYKAPPFPPADIYRISPPAELPNFNITNHLGENINITNFKGKVLLINFWATWCQPCVKELPQLSNLIEIIGTENINIVAISIDTSSSIDKLAKFLQKLHIDNLDIYQDKDLTAYEAVQSIGIPTTIIVDKYLKAHFRISGYLNWENPQIMNIINQLPD